MSTISKFFTKTFTVYRNVWTTDVNGFASSIETDSGTFSGHLQQVSAEQALNLGMNFTTSFQIWCAKDTDVKVGDRLDYNDTFYSVRAIQDNGMVGINQHLQVFVELDINTRE